MLDGLYQSLMCFFMPYLLYNKATFQRPDGLSLDDRQQFGILVASAAVIASNTYVLMNTYRWDWSRLTSTRVSTPAARSRPSSIAPDGWWRDISYLRL